MSKATILAIESSCDETAAAVLRGSVTAVRPAFEMLSAVVNSQIETHQKTGGVVPEVAARAHLTHILPVVQAALQKADLSLDDITHIAVTAGPGLVVSLIVGVEFAKGLALASGKPLIPVNHMAGHLYSAFLDEPAKVQFPLLTLIVSGGHTQLALMKDEQHYRIIGTTQDDAAGEAFDKSARLLGLGYPGGPAISKLAESGQHDVGFPRPMLHEPNFNFSFSGLKTAVLYYIEKHQPLSAATKADVALSFEQAAVDVLVQKTLRAAKRYNCRTISLCGGVAANSRLRQQLSQTGAAAGLAVRIPPFRLCTDNAEMIAIAAYFRLRSGKALPKPQQVQANPRWEL